MAKTIKSMIMRIKTKIKNKITLIIGKIRMRVAIKAVKEMHKAAAKHYAQADKDSKHILNYIVILDKPVKQKNGTFRIKNQLFWINRKNFKRIRRGGWLPPQMKMDELRRKAFYVSSVTRSYTQEYIAKEKAINKYIEYLKFEKKMTT